MTEPGGEPSSGSTTVWMESTTTTDGRTSSSAATIAGSTLSAMQPQAGLARHRAAPPGPAPAACSPRPRRRGRARRPPPAGPAPASSERGLADAGLAAEEGDRARHQASAQDPVELGHPRGPAPRSRSRRPRGSAPAGRPGTSPSSGPAGRPRTSTSSTRVFQPPHVAHRPAHFGEATPHSVHRWVVRTRAIAVTLRRGCDGVSEAGQARARFPLRGHLNLVMRRLAVVAAVALALRPSRPAAGAARRRARTPSAAA